MDETQDAMPEQGSVARETAAQATVTTGGRLLLVYATRHGSTRQIVDAMATAFRASFAEVDVREAAEAPPPTDYDAVVVGGPMIMGWHRAARRYVKRHREALTSTPFALFITAASLTEDGTGEVGGVPVAKDPWLVKAPRNAGKLRRRERYALPGHYLRSIQKACAPARPRDVAFFAGSLDLTTMNLVEKLFLLLVIGATPGDGRHLDFVRDWAAAVGPALKT